jgi:hypothetical protein
LAAWGYSAAFSMSLRVIRPASVPSSLRRINFSMRLSCSWSAASVMETPARAVTRRVVISSVMGRAGLVSKRTSRMVRMPTGLWWSSTMGRPPMEYLSMAARASRTTASGDRVTGDEMIQVSARLTRLTWSACSSMVRFLWMMPRPPSRAMAMSDSVTVSMAAETNGMLNLMLRENRVFTWVPTGRTSE